MGCWVMMLHRSACPTQLFDVQSVCTIGTTVYLSDFNLRQGALKSAGIGGQFGLNTDQIEMLEWPRSTVLLISTLNLQILVKGLISAPFAYQRTGSSASLRLSFRAVISS